ncbi:MAG: MBL fold metallo-hydrolase [Bryobacteraceae bacterium]|nr:MBL fold metallo-hydrolase [Bryobacteraceae bacterium]
MKLTFWGAAQTVTGSMHELRVNGSRILMDCGLYQGRRRESFERNSRLPFAAGSVDAVLLSHAHIDHSGNLPSLTKNGYGGPIYTTAATVDLCAAMLADAAFLQEKDAEFFNKRLMRRKKIDPESGDGAVEPLYSVEDAEAVNPLFRAVPLHTETEIVPGVTYRTVDAGHMLGSTTMTLTLEESGRKRRLTFSGDIGRPGLPIVRDPEPPPACDYLIMESTYGDRLHKELGDVLSKLADIVNRTCARGGRIIVPAFAVGRTQQLVLLLHELIDAGRIPSIPMFVDSPLAVNVTDVFRKHSEDFDAETRAHLERGNDPFGFKRLRYIRDVSESKALNDLRGPFLVISASGMCEAGRILHHLRNNITDPRNTVLITGFQGENTLGRKIVDKLPEVPIFGEPVRLRAEVAKLNELSGHADQRELLAWMKPLVSGVKRVFLVHGEPSQARALQAAIQQTYGVEAVVPGRGEAFSLE